MYLLQRVSIRRDELVTIEKLVAPWEVAVLAAVHGDHNVVPVNESVLDAEPPDARSEYARLERLYGRSENEDGSKGIPFVSAVYGQFAVGEAALRREIKGATIESAPAGVEVIKPKGKYVKIADLICG